MPIRRCPIRSVVDLFAGSGGMGLGLERSGFQTVFVNELNQHALDTYLMNRQGSGLDHPERHSKDIQELTRKPDTLHDFARWIRREHGDIALVVGGPPCQGYSGIGHRRSFQLDRMEVPSNHLYAHMARSIAAIGPKAFVFENVAGLLSARWTRTGSPGEVWKDVLETFQGIELTTSRTSLGYEVRWAKVYSKDYGVPQNRPRLLLVGIRTDLSPDLGAASERVVADGFLPPSTGSAPDLQDLLGDLVDEGWSPGGRTTRYPASASNPIQKELRRRPDGRVARKGDLLSEQEYSNHSAAVLSKFAQMQRNGGHVPERLKTKKFNLRVLPATWGPAGPTITATSLPDDYVHFSLPRTPTVREWARLQTFPDWYQFAGPRTTGGRRRAGDPSIGYWERDLPRYTQIGNAVPVKLAESVGAHLAKVLGLD